MKRFFSRVSVVSFFVLFLSRSTFAQQIPPGSEASAESERYRKEVEAQKQKLLEKEAPSSQIEIKKEEKKPTEATAVSFELKEVVIFGAKYFSPEELRPIYEPYLSKKVTFSDLEEIAKKIQDKYAALGFLTTAAYVPVQDIALGKVEIMVMEGKRGELTIEGNSRVSSGLIERYIHIKKNEILNIKTLQRDLLRLNKNADLEITSAIDKGKVPETSDIVLKVKEKFPHHSGVGSDNQGTRLTGKYRGSAFVSSTNLTGRFDTLFFNSLFSSLTLGESLSYGIPIGTSGTNFGIDLVYFLTKIGKEYKTSDITGKSAICVPHFSWELYLTEEMQAYANAGLEIKSITKKIAGTRGADDQLRVPYFGLTVTKSDTWKGGGRTTFAPRLSFGTEHFLGASDKSHPSASRSGTGGFFSKYEHDLNRIQRMPFDSYAQIRTQFQTATHSLSSSEQIQFGGATSVRGYPEGDYSADTGGSLNLDWIFPMFAIPQSWRLRGATAALRHQIEPVFFVDIAGGELKDAQEQEDKHKFLAGIGGGLRFNFNKAYLRLDWASHIGNEPNSGSGPSTFYMTFQSEF